MSKKVLVISTSIRNGSNSEKLATAFAKGAQEMGNVVEFISLRGKNISFCQGCLACQKTQKCVISDDAIDICDKAKNADVLVFATPVYYYDMCGQMKTLIDRLNPMFSSNYEFRDIYLIAAAAEGDSYAMEGVTKGMQGFVECYEKAKLKGIIAGLSLEGINEAENSPHYSVSYEMGKSV